MKKSSIVVALIILLLTIGWIASGQFNSKNISKTKNITNEENKILKEEIIINVRTEESNAIEINKIISVQGQTNANKIIDIKSEVSGKIVKVNKSVGKKINKNDLIFKISEYDFVINLEQKKSKYEEAEIEFNAENELFEQGLSSNSKIAASKSKLETAKSEYKSIKNEINKTNIYAPFNGILTSDHLEVGEFVQPGTILGQYIELNPILIVAYLSEKELQHIRIGSNANVKTSLNDDIEGKITYISPTAEKGTRTFKIEMSVSNENLSIKDGLTASINIQGEIVKAHKISPSILTLKDNGEVGIKIVNKNNLVEFFPIEIVSDTNNGMWISGIPNNSNIIIVGQEYVGICEKVNFEE